MKVLNEYLRRRSLEGRMWPDFSNRDNVKSSIYDAVVHRTAGNEESAPCQQVLYRPKMKTQMKPFGQILYSSNTGSAFDMVYQVLQGGGKEDESQRALRADHKYNAHAKPSIGILFFTSYFFLSPKCLLSFKNTELQMTTILHWIK